MIHASREQVSSGMPLLAGTVLTGGLSYLATTLSARLLGSADFGVLGAMIGFVSLVSVALRPVHNAATHAASTASAHDEAPAIPGLAGRALIGAGVGGLALLSGQAMLAGPLHGVLPATETWVLTTVMLLIVALGYWQVVSGLLLGAQRFSTFAAASVLDAGVRAAVMVPFASQFGVAGALASYVLGSVGASVLAIGAIGGLKWSQPQSVVAQDLIRVGSSSLLLTLAIAALQNLDIIALTTYAPADQVGWYAAASTVGNLAFTFSAPLYLPLYPRLVSAARRGRPALPVLLTTLAPVLLAGVGASLLTLWVGEPIAGLLFGDPFRPAGFLIPVLFAKATGLVVVFLLGQYAIALRQPRVVLAIVGSAVVAVGSVAAARFGPGGTALLMLAGVVIAIGTSALLLVACHSSHGTSRSMSGRRLEPSAHPGSLDAE